jgi:hypothetical protein
MRQAFGRRAPQGQSSRTSGVPPKLRSTWCSRFGAERRRNPMNTGLLWDERFAWPDDPEGDMDAGGDSELQCPWPGFARCRPKAGAPTPCRASGNSPTDPGAPAAIELSQIRLRERWEWQSTAEHPYTDLIHLRSRHRQSGIYVTASIWSALDTRRQRHRQALAVRRRGLHALRVPAQDCAKSDPM